MGRKSGLHQISQQQSTTHDKMEQHFQEIQEEEMGERILYLVTLFFMY